MYAHVPHFMKNECRSNFPWVTDECRHAVSVKHAAEGIASYTEASERCTAVLQRVRAAYLYKLKASMERLSPGSKKWWTLNKQLLNRQAAAASFPPLRDKSNTWCRTAASKANAFVETWSDKCLTPPESYEHFFFPVPDGMPSHFPIRPRFVKRLLSKLRMDQATGPDGFSALFLRKLAGPLSLPIAILARRIFQEGHWPKKWKLHHIVPIFKRGSVYLPGQYRGIHITSILSKTVERIIGSPLIAYLEQYGYGKAQWAFRKKCGAKDLVTLCMAKWILLICKGHKIGLYLSDISGAFDKVSRALIIGKFSQLGLPSSLIF